MVLESIIFPMKAEKQPWEMFFIGLVYTSAAIFLSLWIFEKEASMVMVFFTVMAALPIIYNTLKLEEYKDMELSNERLRLKQHSKAILIFLFLFLGMTVAFVFWYTVLPSSTVAFLFQKQAQTITSVNNQIAGNAVSQVTLFSKILLNNLKVLAFCILFSFIYGSGAIFILTWNASVIATAIGNFIRTNIAHYALSVGSVNAFTYFQVISLGLLRYFIHGLPEIIAYIYGALAGGIISVAVIRRHFQTKNFFSILIDVSDLLLIAIGFLVLAAFIEVYLTPKLF
ncbi:MAG: stage II sporulation protein M [Candidatus Woesearchaeota archaeon]|nr:stage II sporulation protein M [Candidatus Woesearchaeota archaeon]